jgi:hypothetical protein
VRRDATKLKRALEPVMRLMDRVIDGLPAWATGWSHDPAHRLTHAAMNDLQAVQERARSLQDAITARQPEETDRRLYIVSLVTTLFLSATFATGLFGMNTGGMVIASSPMGTLVGAGLCLTSPAGTWLLLQWRRRQAGSQAMTAPKRFRPNSGLIARDGASAAAASSSPSAGECLKPWPEQHEAARTVPSSRSRSMMNPASGVTA